MTSEPIKQSSSNHKKQSGQSSHMKSRKWIRGLLIAVLSVVSLLGVGSVFQVIATAAGARAYPPPGELVDVGGYNLHLNCIGEGRPTVVLDAGAGNWSIFWSKVQPILSQNMRVCSFDRAGYGWSDTSPKPRTGKQMMSELHTLLENANIEQPFVLVGHSLGGYNTRLYADAYSDELAGVVLLESAHEEQWQRLPVEVGESLNAQIRALKQGTAMARVGLMRALKGQLPKFDLPKDMIPVYEAAMVQPKTFNVTANESSLASETAAQVAETKSLGDLPLLVISARHSFDAFRELSDAIPFEEADKVWMELQGEFVGLSSHSQHVISETGGHYLHVDEPEFVSHAISQFVKELKTVQ